MEFQRDLSNRAGFLSPTLARNPAMLRYGSFCLKVPRLHLNLAIGNSLVNRMRVESIVPTASGHQFLPGLDRESHDLAKVEACAISALSRIDDEIANMNLPAEPVNWQRNTILS